MAYTHNVFEPKQMASLNVDSLVRTVVLASDADNGTAVVIGNPGTTIFSEVEIGAYAATKASAATDIIAILDGDGNSLADGYDVGLIDPRGFTNVANKATRARILLTGDEFMIPTAAINGAFVAQPYIVVDVTGGEEGKFELVDSASGYAFIGKILSRAVPVLFGNTKVDFTLVRVIRNSNDSTLAIPYAQAAVAGGILAATKGVGETVEIKIGADHKLYAPTYFAAANQGDSVAIDVAGLLVDFNALLAKLKAAGLMAADA